MSLKNSIEWKIRFDMEDGRIFMSDKAILLDHVYVKDEPLPEKGKLTPVRVLEILDQPTLIRFGLDDMVRKSKTSYLAPGGLSLGHKYISFLRKLSLQDKLHLATWGSSFRGVLLLDGDRKIGGLAPLDAGEKTPSKGLLKSAQDLLNIIPKDTRAKAEAGCVKSQELLAYMYGMASDACPEYEDETLKWLLLAAKHGAPKLQCSLGYRYHEGIGVPQDFTLAAKWLQKAADQNHPVALRLMGSLYCRGVGVPLDSFKGAVLVEKAISLGDEKAIQVRTILKNHTSASDYRKVENHVEQHLEEWSRLPPCRI